MSYMRTIKCDDGISPKEGDIIVYILTTGSYSSYEIEGVFLDKDKAEKVANERGYDIEEYLVDRNDFDGYLYHIYIQENGWVKVEWSDFENSKYAKDVIEFIGPNNDGSYYMLLNIFIKGDKDNIRAVKIVSDYWAIIKANNLWLDVDKANAVINGGK